MHYVIGTDEAGYGPNLGPLVVAASVWEVPEDTAATDMYRLLRKAVVAKVPSEKERRLAIADSKALYNPACGLRHLERGVHVAWGLLERCAATWRAVWPLVSKPDAQWLDDLPWHAGYDLALPCDTTAADVATRANFVREHAGKCGVRLIDLHADVVYPARFNDLVDKYNSKGEVLSLVTLGLVAEQVKELPAGDVRVTCDKHGGRGHYAALLQHLFPDGLVAVRSEGRLESTYRVQCPERTVEFCFLAKGERMLPTALASMLAKYLRELAMLPFNEFWQREVAGLKRTAGYYTDAKRFWDDIRATQQKLQIGDRLLWRNR